MLPIKGQCRRKPPYILMRNPHSGYHKLFFLVSTSQATNNKSTDKLVTNLTWSICILVAWSNFSLSITFTATFSPVNTCLGQKTCDVVLNSNHMVLPCQFDNSIVSLPNGFLQVIQTGNHVSALSHLHWKVAPQVLLHSVILPSCPTNGSPWSIFTFSFAVYCYSQSLGWFIVWTIWYPHKWRCLLNFKLFTWQSSRFAAFSLIEWRMSSFVLPSRSHVSKVP